MQLAIRIPEIAQRDRFVKRAVAQKHVFAVAGEDGLARVTSPHDPRREVTLLWTTETEAARWADVLTVNPRVKQIALGGLIADVLPRLYSLDRVIGMDWSAEPIEPEIEPMDLVQRLRLEGVDTFLQRVRLRRAVWMLEDANGPALLVSHKGDNQLVLPAWATRGEAEARIEGPWRDMIAVEIPLPNFISLTLPWLASQGWLVAAGHAEGASTIEMQPAELARRFAPEAASA
ncbi:MAG: DUF2750 domain-containing protein [Hyphomicrobiaceae bacterium]